MKDKIVHSFADLGSTGAGYDIALKYQINYKIFILMVNLINVLLYIINLNLQFLKRLLINNYTIRNTRKRKTLLTESRKKNSSIYTYEPDEETILKDLLPKNVSIQIFKVLLESNAGEQGARMAAMDNATRNAGEMIDSLTLVYNRTRQAFITKELIEIISGAESV